MAIRLGLSPFSVVSVVAPLACGLVRRMAVVPSKGCFAVEALMMSVVFVRLAVCCIVYWDVGAACVRLYRRLCLAWATLYESGLDTLFAVSVLSARVSQTSALVGQGPLCPCGQCIWFD